MTRRHGIAWVSTCAATSVKCSPRRILDLALSCYALARTGRPGTVSARSPGSLGQDCRSGIDIMGTLNEPVHATNLKEAIAEIERLDRRPLVIAVDACLGRSENVGYINVCRGPLKPGTGVNKVLPEVGDMHITGIVNVGGYMEYLVLQNTRLSLVMRMATSIAKAIQYAAGLDGPSVQAEGLREQTSPLLARQESAVADGTPPSAVGPHL